MAEQTKRSLPKPLLVPTLSWCVGIGIATILHIPLLWLALFSIIALGAGFLLRFRLPLLILLFALAGFIRLTIAIDHEPSQLQTILSTRESITQPCTGEVIKVLDSNHSVYRVKLNTLNGITIKEFAILYYAKPLLPGDKFKVLCKISLLKPDPVLSETSFYRQQLYQQVTFTLNPVYKLTKLSHPRVINLERWRYYLLQSLDQKLGSEAPFGKALLLNDRTNDTDWIQQLIQGGLLHLIAISGLHVLFFYYIFITMMNLVLPRKVTELVFLILMLFYAGLCQWSAPVMRAIVMILLLMIARWLQRPVSPLQIINLSLFIITLFDPIQLFSIGLQLSYCCVVVLLYIVPKWRFNKVNISAWKRSLLSGEEYLLDTVIISILVSFVLLPLTLFYFQRGSLNGIIGNIIGVPIIGLLLPMTFLLLIFPTHWAIWEWLKASFDVLYYAFQHWVAWTAKLPFYLDTVSISLPWLVVAYLIIAALVIRIKSGVKARWLAYTLLIIAVPIAAYTQFPKHRPFTMTVFNAGLGDCTLVQFPHGQTLMIDTGPTGFGNQKAAKPSWMQLRTIGWFRHHDINTIDLLVLSHLHDDHAGGLKDLLRNLNVRNLMLSSTETNTTEWQQLMQSGLLKEAQIKIISDTLTFPFANSTISVLNPAKGFNTGDENDNSLVLRLDYKNFSALMAGDITSKAEEHLIESNPVKLDCDLLKVPHHGSKYSSSADFIRAVSPRQAIITAPLHNRFHFPDKESMARYHAYGIEPQLTGNGSVVVTIP